MKRVLLGLLAALMLVFAGCDDDDDNPTSSNGTPQASVSTLKFVIKLPEGLNENKLALDEATIVLKNVNTGQKITQAISDTVFSGLDVEVGVYDIMITGKVTYMDKDASGVETQQTADIRAAKENINAVEGKVELKLDVFLYNHTSGFVLSEIFFTRSKRGYRGDQFFEIYNNTDQVLYADGLCIGGSEFNTTLLRKNLNPDVRGEKAALRVIYRVPGNGTEYPIQPGKTLVLCDVAKNHQPDNPSSLDLSQANFEWYDDHKYDVDVPEVANLEKVVSYSKTIWMPNDRGLYAYVIFRLDNSTTAEQFAKDYSLTYEYELSSGSIKQRSCLAIPNDWVMDAVELSTPSKFKWKALAPSLDLTWTHSGDADDSRYGHSVKRKASYVAANGRIVLQDTDDSLNDFIATAPNPSPGVVENAKN